jgi:predicted ATPase/DNA-binding winged helix-turn-helix (wHTH) protein
VLFSFDEFVLDLDRFELRRGDEPLAAEPQVLELLAHLLHHRDRVVTKEELFTEVWDGRIVSDSALSRAVREVRRLLGDSAAESRFVRTLYGRGFRFVGDAEELIADADASDTLAAGTARQTVSQTKPPLAVRPLPAPLTPLIGRERELAEATALLDSTRLLTLTGAAGVGKSRLALALAGRAATRFSDGALFVPLAEVAEPRAVTSEIARALELTDAAGESTLEALRLQLQERNLLVVLDNFEQVIEAAPDIVELLQSCPELTALVTSRFVLRAQGEQEYLVGPLTLPGRDASVETRRQAPAVALFLARAQAVLPSFNPDEQELAYVAEICRRLDGLPLALELAASQVKVFPLRDLWERLAERFDLLSSRGRHGDHGHRTLEQALDWSFELLNEVERRVLSRLAVLSGGFDMPAAQAICGANADETVQVVAALVDKSLIDRLPPLADTARFHLLETTRAQVVDRLREPQEEDELRRVHAEWYAQIARRGAAALTGGDQQRWLRSLDADHSNLMAAMEWSRAGGDLATGVSIGAALSRYWSARAAYRGGRRELEALLSSPEVDDVPATIRVDGLIALGSLTHLMCEYRAASQPLEAARQLLADLEDGPRLAEVTNHLAWIAAQIAPLGEAETLALEGLAANRSQGDARGIAVALNNLGQIAFHRADLAAAEDYFEQSLEQRREARDERGIVFALANRAMARLLLGGGPQPVDRWLEEARSRLEPLGDPPLEGWVENMEARSELARGRPEAALDRLQTSPFDRPEISHPDGEAWVHLSIGDTYQALGDLDAARQEIEQAAKIWDSIESNWGRATTAQRLARLAELEDREEEARDRYREVSEIRDRFGLKVWNGES